MVAKKTTIALAGYVLTTLAVNACSNGPDASVAATRSAASVCVVDEERDAVDGSAGVEIEEETTYTLDPCLVSIADAEDGGAADATTDADPSADADASPTADASPPPDASPIADASTDAASPPPDASTPAMPMATPGGAQPLALPGRKYYDDECAGPALDTVTGISVTDVLRAYLPVNAAKQIDLTAASKHVATIRFVDGEWKIVPVAGYEATIRKANLRYASWVAFDGPGAAATKLATQPLVRKIKQDYWAPITDKDWRSKRWLIVFRIVTAPP